jgi:hypothetical protein
MLTWGGKMEVSGRGQVSGADAHSRCMRWGKSEGRRDGTPREARMHCLYTQSSAVHSK